MIKNIPRAQDFREVGFQLLHNATDTILDLQLEWYRHLEEGLADDEIEADYWQAASRRISTALTVVQQATDFLMKGRIAAVSPFLLIAGDPQNWPCGSKAKNFEVDFAAFRTIDSRDLTRVHDTCVPQRLSDEFRTIHESMRKRRNSLMHTVDPGIRVEAKEVLLGILEVFKEFEGAASWLSSRRSYLPGRPEMVPYGGDLTLSELVIEFEILVSLLSPSEAIRLLGFPKRRRRYICPTCRASMSDYDPDFVPQTALLDPNTPSSTHVYCVVCDCKELVERKSCPEPQCKEIVRAHV